MHTRFSRRTGMALTFILGLVIAGAATAGAASLITGKQIKDGSVSAKDLSKAVRAQLGRTGAAGVSGPKGETGPGGPAGTAGATGPRGEAGASAGTFSQSANPSPITTTGFVPILTTGISPGIWILNAKLTLENTDPTVSVFANCRLTAGADVDSTTVRVPPAGGRVSLSLMLAHTESAALASKSPAISCNTGGATADPNDAAISGVLVRELVAGQA